MALVGDTSIGVALPETKEDSHGSVGDTSIGVDPPED